MNAIKIGKLVEPIGKHKFLAPGRYEVLEFVGDGMIRLKIDDIVSYSTPIEKVKAV